MAIKDLKIRQGNVDIIVDIVDVGEARQFSPYLWKRIIGNNSNNKKLFCNIHKR